MNKFDDSLKVFMKENQPIPPEPRPGELHQILMKLESGENSKNPKRDSVWIKRQISYAVFGGALAASFVALVLQVPPLSRPSVEPSSSSLAWHADRVSEVDEFILDGNALTYESETPSQEVGEEYLSLVAGNSL